MIYLYDGDAKDFTYQGKPLPKSYDVDVKFLMGEEFYVTFSHPLDENEVYKQIKEDKIITAHTPNGLQPFRILKPKKNENHVHLEAWPLLYADMRNKKVKPLSLINVDMTAALRVFVNSLLMDTPFVFTSNITDRRDYHTQDVDEAENNPNDLFDALEVFKALVNRWQGELYIDGYDIRVLDRLGTDTQALLYEKKNISEFVDETNMGSIITRVHGKSEWTDEAAEGETEGEKHVITTTVDSPLINEYSGVIFEEQYTNNNIRTEQEMINWLNLKFTTENIDKPQRSITAGTNVINGHYLSVGDSLILKYIKHDVDMSIRMIGYNYDGYDNMYKQVILGEAKSSVSGTINRDINESNNLYKELEKNTTKWLDDIRVAIVNSYFNEDGYNYDLQADNEYGLPGGYYSFDAPIYNNPSKVIYMGAGQLLIANSKNSAGEWEWKTAATGDGIVADVINTGTLRTVLLEGGSNPQNNFWDLSSGEFRLGDEISYLNWNSKSRRLEMIWEDTDTSISFANGSLVSTAKDGSQSYIQRGTLGARNPGGSGLGHIGYRKDPGGSPQFNVQTSWGAHFTIHSNLSATEEKKMMQITSSSDETLFYTKYFRLLGEHLNIGWNHYLSGSTRRLLITGDESIALRANESTVFAVSNNGSKNFANLYADLDMGGSKVINSSDVRLKDEIENTKINGIKETKRLRIVDWNWKKDHPRTKGYSSERQFGIIAQDTPFLAVQNSDEHHYLGIDLMKHVNLNTLTNQELIEKVEHLEETVEQLKGKVND